MSSSEKNIVPPRLAVKLLHAFFRDAFAEEVEGDLEEKFYTNLEKKSKLRTKLNYWLQVINYLRPFAIKKSKPHYSNQSAMLQNYFKIGYLRVKSTISNLRQYKNIVRFLFSFFIYNDGILTVIAFASIIAVESYKFTTSDLVIFFISVQSSAIVGSILFVVINDKIGAKKSLQICLFLWFITVVSAAFVISRLQFYIMGFVVGMLLGSTQSSSRCLMAKLCPEKHHAEFFGFYDGLCGKASAIFGPLLFGFISYLSGNQRWAILAISIVFPIGFLLLKNIEEKDV